MAVERVYVGDQPVTVSGHAGEVQPGDTVSFAEDPNHPLFVTKSEATDKRKSAKES